MVAASVQARALSLRKSLRVSRRILAQAAIETSSTSHDYGCDDESIGNPQVAVMSRGASGKRSKKALRPTQTRTTKSSLTPTPTPARAPTPTPTLSASLSNKRRKIKQEDIHINSNIEPHLNIKSELPMTPPTQDSNLNTTQTSLEMEPTHVYDRQTIVLKQESPSTSTSTSTSTPPPSIATTASKKAVKKEPCVSLRTPARALSQPTPHSTRSLSDNEPRRKRSLKPTPIKAPLAPRDMPSDFFQVWKLVSAFRQPRDAPVDIHGAEVLGIWRPYGSPKQTQEEYRFSVLVALMLSSQTKDDVTGAAVRALKCEAVERKMAFGPAFILDLGDAKLDQIIGKVGFHNNKTKFLRQSSELMLDTTWGIGDRKSGCVPSTLKDLLTLPGIGPKMGYLISTIAFKGQFGLGVDVHMHRIFHDLKWTDDKTFSQGPEATRVILESWLPKAYWDHINVLFVGFGQQAQQQRGRILRRVCRYDQSAFPGEMCVPALELLRRAGGLSKAVKTSYLTFTESSTKETPLMWVAQVGNLEAAKYLITHGNASVSAKDKLKNTALDHAKKHNHTTLVTYLATIE